MWDCEAAIRDLVASIEPSPAQKTAASRSHNYLRDVMDTGLFGSRILDSYLTGSYARDTAIAPIDDVDIIFVVDGSAWTRDPWFARPNPEKILASFAAAIRYRYPASSVYTQRRSLRLALNHLDIDVVPAVVDSTFVSGVYIPDADTGDWIRSAPKRHAEIATQVNQACAGRLKPLVRLLKYWNAQLPGTAHFKSFAVETLATTLFRHFALPTYQDGLRMFFDFVAGLDGKASLYSWPNNLGISLNWWATEIPDLAGSGSNLAADVDADRRTKFVEHAVQSRDWMIRAANARGHDFAVSHIRSALRM